MFDPRRDGGAKVAFGFSRAYSGRISYHWIQVQTSNPGVFSFLINRMVRVYFS